MGAKKKRKDEEAETEEEVGRGKRTKKPSNKWAMSGVFEILFEYLASLTQPL